MLSCRASCPRPLRWRRATGLVLGVPDGCAAEVLVRELVGQSSVWIVCAGCVGARLIDIGLTVGILVHLLARVGLLLLLRLVLLPLREVVLRCISGIVALLRLLKMLLLRLHTAGLSRAREDWLREG